MPALIDKPLQVGCTRTGS